jgi:hypothetical protein
MPGWLRFVRVNFFWANELAARSIGVASGLAQWDLHIGTNGRPRFEPTISFSKIFIQDKLAGNPGEISSGTPAKGPKWILRHLACTWESVSRGTMLPSHKNDCCS